MLNAFKKLFTPKTTKIALKKGIRSRLELVSLEDRVVPATFTVLNDSDSGAGSLRAAIELANATAGNDIINFSITGTITLDSQNNTVNASLPTILSANATASGGGGTVGTLTINGPGSSSLIISGLDNGNNGRNFNIFNIATGGNLTISGLTVSGAQTSGNGGGFNNSGTLNIANSTISGNIATGNSRYGGGINNSGTLTITNSTLSGNTGRTGGGINNSQSGILTITNSTLSGNTAISFGGGINNYNSLTVTNCTLSGNSAATAGGLQNNGTLNIANTIIANSPSGGDYFGGGTIGTNLDNLVEDGTLNDTTGSSSGSGNISGDPVLSPLADNGGPTFTMALGATSPAIAAGNASVSNVAPIFGLDQRGYVRSTTAPSIGAFEFNGAIQPVPTVTQNLSNLAINATTLIITGTGFSTIAANNTVLLSSGTGTVTSATATQLTVTFNTAPTPGELKAVVTTNSISSGSEVEVATIVEVPTITSISPGAGPTGGGTTITINGSFFTNVTAVTIGGIAASSFTVVNGQKITAITPPGTRGAANVFVTDNNGTNSTTVNTVFNYTAGAFITPAVPFSPAFPHALSINAPGSAVTDSASFTVTFNQPVTGVDAADFNLVATGTVANGTISSVTGSGATYTVNVTGITGSGSLGVNLVSLPTITALPSFAAQATFSTGSKPASVTLGDVDGDGKLDMITANFNSASVSVLLGNGNGTFKTQSTFDTGANPRAVTLGDVNGDGLLDIITANQGSNNASVLLGNGDGAFKAQTTFATGTQPRSVALGDVNGDGTLDIITANQGANNASVLLGTGNGSFARQATFATASLPYSVALGDVNGDGKLDIVAANRSGSFGSLLLGNGDGTFKASEAFNAGGSQVYVALGDLNGDGKLDIVTPKPGNDVVVLIGNGNGTFKDPLIFSPGVNPRSVTLGDVNGDGILDIMTANEGSNNTGVALGNGNGTFKNAVTFATGTNSRSATLGDVNGDGRLDIIAANYNSDNASVLLGTGGSAITATFSPQQTFAAGFGAQSVALGDVNGDGKLDMVTANGGNSTASVLLGNGNGTFKTQGTFSTGNTPRSVTLGDVNGDGKLDIITANRDSDTVSVLLNTTVSGSTTPTFQTQVPFSTGSNSSPRSVALGDVNGDGKLDIITANNNAGASVLLGNGNGIFQTQSTFSTGISPRAVTLGDVNGDGKLDIITANNGDASASVLLGNGNGTFQGQQTFATGSNPRAVTLGDVNGDGNLDIITANFTANSASVLLGNGNGSFKNQVPYATGNSPYSVTLGDVNGDGRLDITTGSYSSDTASVLLGNGNGTFQTQAAFAVGDGPLSVTLGDVNGDGRLDITTANSNSGDASVLLNSIAFTGQTATVAPSVTLNTTDLLVTATTLIIDGTGFDTIAANNTVTLSSGTGTVSSATATQLTVTLNTASSFGSLTAVVTTNTISSGSPVQVANIVGVANTPTFGTPTATSDGFTVQISNYDNNFTYGGTATANGTVAISNTGLVTVTGVAANTSSTATITTTRTNYATGSAQVTATSLNAANTPTFGSPTATTDGFTVQISNYDNNFTYGGTATANGTVAISNTGLVTVTGVAANTSSTATITTTRTNYVSGSAQVTATSLAATPLVVGTPPPASSGGSSSVTLYDPVTGAETGTAVPFPGFNGPIKVVSGDFNNDGVAEIFAGAGFGGGPAIAILNSQTGEVMEAFFAFDQAFTGGVFVAVQDVNGDGILDIIASAGPTGGPEVRIFDGNGLTVLRSFYAYAVDFTGGVSVASVDFNNDGILDLVTGAGPGGAPHVKVYDGATNAIISQWYAYATDFTGGVFVAIGDISNDGTFEVVTGAGQGGSPVVGVWDPNTGALLAQFMAYAEDFTGGVRVGVNDGNTDGIADIVTGAGPGGGPQVNVFNFPALDLLFSFYSGDPANTGGVFVG
ncbi:MAG: hypothetical protein DWH70_05185 [Planctomycetota bacterium]|nr:MAG: hypothetical protein DWH70_05185 [Planctomycetota bacterium]